jgi:RHH-type rel operon transcriptional repressor/antitoxin RelB
MSTNAVLAIRVPEEVKRKLDLLAQATGRTRSFLALDAIRCYVDAEAWQIREIKKAVREADKGDFASPTQVKKIFSKWKVNADLPYIIPYRVRGENIEILRALHAARKWPQKM